MARPAGERFRHLPHQEQIRRTGQQEATRPAVPIDGPLHGAEQTWLALHLIEGHRLIASHQRFRIASGGIEHVEVVQRAVAPFAMNELLGKGAADQTGKGIHAADDLHSPQEW